MMKIATAPVRTWLVSLVSMLITACCLIAAVYLLSQDESKIRYGIYAGIAAFIMFPLFLYVARMKEAAAYSIFDWLKSFVTTLSLVAASLLIDLILGRLSHPDLPLYMSVFSTVGVWVTLFLIPALLATIYCTINAMLLKLLDPA